MNHRARFEYGVRGQIDNEFHAHGPIVLVMAVGQAEMIVELLADRPDRTVANHRERGTDVHTRREAVSRVALLVHTLVEQPDSGNFVVLDQRHGRRRGRPDLHRARA